MAKPSTSPAPPALTRRWSSLVIPCLIALVGVAAYSNSLHGQFVLDDKRNIQTDIPLRTLWPTHASLLGPPWTTFTGRPLVMFTFAMDYRIHGIDPLGYHLVNIIIHLLAGLTLWGVLRRTLQLPILRQHFTDRADWIAGAIALIWIAHPLCSASVSYISQRAESLMGLFYLLTVYCFIRGATGSRAWHLATIVSCLLGLATKEPMISAPLFVLLYDRTLLAGTFSGALKQRKWLYIGLAATWVPFFVLISLHPHGPDVAFNFPDLSSLDYLKTQAWVLTRYLRLSFWPMSLVLYYGRANESVEILRRFPEYAPYGLLIVLLLAATTWLLIRRSPAALLGAWFFLILAPSSTIIAMPTEVLAEYRMYLPLIAVITAAVLAGDWLLKRKAVAGAVASLTIIALALGTRQRNLDYATTLSMWQDIVKKIPNNVIALTNLGMFKYLSGDFSGAERDFRRAMELNPKSGAAFAGLGMLAEGERKFPEAVEHYRRAIKEEPQAPESYLNLAMVLANEHQYDQAVEILTRGAEKVPWEQDLSILLGAMMIRAGHDAPGRAQLDRAIEADFDHAHAAEQAGELLLQLNLPEFATDYFQRSADLSSDDPQTYLKLAMLLTQQGKISQAMEQFKRVLSLSPDNLITLNNLAWFYATSPDAGQRDGKAALSYAQRAVTLTQAQDPGALDTLAAAYAETGQFDQARKAAQQAIDLFSKTDPAAAEMKQRLELYRANRPFRDQPILPGHSSATPATHP